jgi:hypothetical protein
VLTGEFPGQRGVGVRRMISVPVIRVCGKTTSDNRLEAAQQLPLAINAHI